MKGIDVSLIVNEAIAEVLKIELKDITDDSTLKSLGADSLDVIDIFMYIEDSLEIEIENDAIIAEDSVTKLTAQVKELVEA